MGIPEFFHGILCLFIYASDNVIALTDISLAHMFANINNIKEYSM